MTDNTRIQGMQFEINDLKKQLLTNMDEMNRSLCKMKEQQRRTMEEFRSMFASLVLRPEASRQQMKVFLVGKKSSCEHNFYNLETFCRIPGFEIPQFRGEDLKGWLLKCEQFFRVNNIPANDKVRLVAAQLEGQALQWHRIYLKGRLTRDLPRWKDYVFALHSRFGVGFGFNCFDNSMDELMNLEQSGNVQSYINDFEEMLKSVDLSEDMLINCFVRGLRDDIEIQVRMCEPKTLQKAFSLAKLQEQILDLATVKQSCTPVEILLSAPSILKETTLDSLHIVELQNDFQPQAGESLKEVHNSNKPSSLLLPSKMNENQTQDLCYQLDANLESDYEYRKKEHLFALVADVKDVEENERCKVLECKVVKEEETKQETNLQLLVDVVAGVYDCEQVEIACPVIFTDDLYLQQGTIEQDFLKLGEWKWWLADIEGLIMDPKSFENRAKEYCSALRERHHTYEYHLFKGFFHRRKDSCSTEFLLPCLRTSIISRGKI